MPSAAIESSTATPKKGEKPWSHPDRQWEEWEVRDAMHTLMKADEHKQDPKLMAEVKKHAAEHAEKMKAVSQQAARLAKSGHISGKHLEKIGKA